MYLEADIIVHGAVGNLEHGCKVLNDNIKIGKVWSTNDAVVHKDANNKINKIIGGRPVVDASIDDTGKEIIEFEKMVKGVIP